MEDNGLESEESRRPNSICCRINNFQPRFMGKVYTTASAFLSLQFSLFLFTLFLENAFAMDMLSQSQGLSVRQTLISSNQLFELGFFSPGNSGKRYVGIWCKNISWHKAIWVANRENALTVADSASSLTIGSDGNLKLLDGMKNTVWSTNVSSPHPNSTISVLSDTGNLSLKDNVSGLTLWDSFNYPSDSFIAGMKIGFNKKTGENYVVTSWHAEDDPSPGNFVMGFTTDTPPQNILWNNSKTRWRSGPWDGWRFIGVPETGKGFSNGFTVTQDNQQGSVYGFLSPASMLQVMIEFVTPDGNLKVSRWEIGTQEGFVDWEAIKVFCDVYGACGPFGFCDRSRPTCECLKGFVPKSMHEWKKGNWTSGCVRRTELACGNNKTKHDGFAKLSMMKVPDHYTYLFNMNASDCQQQCSSNCSCLAYAHVEGIGCLAWDRDLLDIQQFSSNGVDLFLRLAHSELDEEKKNIKLMVSLITIFGVIILGAFIYALLRCIEKRKAIIRHRKQEKDLFDKMAPVTGSPMREMWGHPLTPTESSDLLPMVDFNTVAAATNNFSETNKLGAGGFGPVYKGKLEDGQEIAVKRLSNLSGQGAVEFRNEILLISKLQHRNLVRLLGYCIKGDEKLLIYEYLKNKSLDTFLFDTRMGMQLDWDKRFNIIDGIARGLLYLHRDSCLRVIHRDLKPSNILLDDNMNPKISDFGLARAFQITQELANTHRVVGTFGYMSPEYAMGGLLSEKSDVFSFGVMLLEIISGERNTSFLCEEKYLNLLGYAWHLWNEGKGLDLMNRQLSDSCSAEDFMKYMQIALLCIQDYAFDRPTMSAVVLMLTGDTIIPQPRQPTFCMGLPYSDLLSQFSRPSMNDDSITQVEGR